MGAQPQYRLTINGGFLVEHGRLEKISLAILAAKPSTRLYVKPSADRQLALALLAPDHDVHLTRGDLEYAERQWPDWVGSLLVLVRATLHPARPPLSPPTQEDPA